MGQETEDLADSEPAEFVVLPQMRIRLRPSLAVRCEIGADEAMFVDEESGKTMRLRIAPSVSHLVCALAKRRSFTQIRDLPTEDAYERLCFVQLLYERECIQVMTGRDLASRRRAMNNGHVE